MTCSPGSFRESKDFLRGRSAEKLVAEELQRRGWYIVPSYDYSGKDNNKAPRLQGTDKEYILPDLDVSKEGARRWVEVKLKLQATWTHLTQRFEHGIPIRHFESYVEVQRITGCEVWIFIYEENTQRLLVQSLNCLTLVSRVYRGPKMNREGMIYFPQDSFCVLRRHPL